MTKADELSTFPEPGAVRPVSVIIFQMKTGPLARCEDRAEEATHARQGHWSPWAQKWETAVKKTESLLEEGKTQLRLFSLGP